MADDLGATYRRAAADVAVAGVQSDMTLGLGTGRAAGFAIEALARRQREEGLRINGVASSRATEERARALGLVLISLDDSPTLDMTIDGADEVDPQRRLLKGGGGALLREKVLAAAAGRLVIIVEYGKLVPHLGATRGVPLEVLPFAWAACAEHLRRLGGEPALRREPRGVRFVTDNGNWVLDCRFPHQQLDEVERLDRQLHAIPGLLETGLFVDFDPVVYAGGPDGVSVTGR